MQRMSIEKCYRLGFAAIQGVMAYEWLSAGWEKVSSPAFVEGIAKTLEYFASQNPFPWYKNFLNSAAIPNGTPFAYAVEWSQIIIAVTLFASAAAIVYAKKSNFALAAGSLALIGGMLMNANFYLAAAWTGPGTKGLNLVMFLTQGILLSVWLAHRKHLKNSSE